jgi:hypothetical protein
MQSFDVDQHPQYPHSQCISVDRIEYEIGRRGYFRHPRLGKLYATVSHRQLAFICLAWMAVCLIFIGIDTQHQAAARIHAANQQAQIDSLIIRLQMAEATEDQLGQCITTMSAARLALDKMEKITERPGTNPQAASVALRIVAVLKTIL